jgi:DivIVA domain-containing protein
MELSSQAINGIEFDQVRKGYDPEQVKSFLSRVGAAVDEMRSHLVASDARARAAMARVQELSAREPAAVGSADTDVISKTLLMAQRTADAAVADAQKSADATLADADSRSKTMLAESEARSTEMIRQAELMATQHMESELRTLKERKASLSTEVDQLNERIVAERERVAAVIESLQRLLRSPEGLGTLSYRPASNTAAPAPAPAAFLGDQHDEAMDDHEDDAFAAPQLRLSSSVEVDEAAEGHPTGEVPLTDPWKAV